MHRTAAAAFAAFLLLLGACAGNIDPSRQMEDAAVAASVRDALRADTQLRPYNIDVRVQQGAVTLTGRVRTAALRDHATSVVQAVQGVGRVENLLSVE